MSEGPEGDAPRQRPTFDVHLVALAGLAGLALLLRWYRLDLVSFRYDNADALFRAREVFALGYPPLTGITNSLGFRNPAGFIWAILPGVLVSPRVEVVTAWVGLLTMTGLWPLYKMGRRYLSGWAWLLPCAAYACMPPAVFGGRNIWAQNLMPALGAWALAGILSARDPKSRTDVRGRAFVTALAALGLALLIHLSGAAYLVAAALLLAGSLLRRELKRRSVIAGGAVLLLTALAFLPSVLDWQAARESPRPKPDYVQKFEANMPPPPPIHLRLRDALAGQFGFLSSVSAATGLENQVGESVVRAASAIDLLLFLLGLGGLGILLLGIRTRSSHPADTRGEPGGLRSLGWVLLLWLLIPALLGAVFIPRLNPTYFAPSLPAVLLIAALPLGKAASALRWGWVPVTCAVVVAGIYSLFFFAAMRAVDTSRFAVGQYYLPLADQERLARRFKQAGVPAGQIDHLSGGWYQLPYDYLHRAVVGAERAGAAGEESRWAVMDDTLLRRQHPRRVAWLEESMPGRLGPVRYVIVSDRRTLEAVRHAFFSVPME